MKFCATTGNQNTPVTIESEEGQRSEEMEMSFDSSAGQVYEQTGGEHRPTNALFRRDRVTAF
jgi:hypothetical protein